MDSGDVQCRTGWTMRIAPRHHRPMDQHALRSGISAARALLALLAAVPLAAAPGATPSSVLQPGTAYVAMGSSYAAGAGIGPLQAGSPERCQRTANNYPSLLARRHGLRLTDVSCGGATTANLLSAWNELPAQLDALTPGTRLVTVTIGGNDLNYMGALFGASCRAGVSIRPGPCPPPVRPVAADYARLEASLDAVAKQITRRAPRATVVFVQYLTAVPEVPCERTALSAAEAATGRDIGRQLARITARVAAANGARVLPADELSLDHTACAKQPWSHGLYAGYDLSQGTPWHPAPEGHAAIAAALGEMLAR